MLLVTIMKFEELAEIYESGKLSAERQDCLRLFLSAAGDWPGDFDTTEEYLSLLNNYFEGVSITSENISKKIVTVDRIANAWHIESLITLKEAMQVGETTDVVDLVKNIRSWVGVE